MFTPTIPDSCTAAATKALKRLRDSGQSEAIGVFECLATIAESAPERGKDLDDVLIASAEEIITWAAAFIGQMTGRPPADVLHGLKI